MADGVIGRLHRPGTSPLHHRSPQCKLVATLAFVVAVVMTPREQFWAFGLHALVVLGLAVVAGLPMRTLVRRLGVEVPFVAFAVALPFLAGGRRTPVGPLSLSVEGLWGAWNIVAKGTLGVGASVVLAATTSAPDLVRGLQRVRVPTVFTTIFAFMVRYLDVLASDVRRMRIARLSRGYDPRWFWQARAVALSAGTLFIRSYERGERVYLAMLSRGYEGSMPGRDEGRATVGQWSRALVAPALAASVTTVAWWARG